MTDQVCRHSYVTFTQYVPFNLATLSYRLDQTYNRMVQMFGVGDKINFDFPREKILRAVIDYKTVVREQVDNPTALECTSIVLVLAVKEGICTVCGSWLIHDSNGKPFQVAKSPSTLLAFQLFSPDEYIV
jgi:hypothetical protein